MYARVSTTDQDCELQLRELRDYCARRGWEIAREYVDRGWSGAKASRPELDRLMADAAAHRFDSVAVWKLDRFGRSVANLVDAIGKLRSWEIRFLATSQAIDTDQANPASQLTLHILAAVAEFEREMIRERVKAGMSVARSKGKRCGRPAVMVDRKRVLGLAKAGLAIRAIADQLGISRSVVGRLVASQKVTAIALLYVVGFAGFVR